MVVSPLWLGLSFTYYRLSVTIVQSHLGYAIDATSLNLVANITHLEIA